MNRWPFLPPVVMGVALLLGALTNLSRQLAWHEGKPLAHWLQEAGSEDPAIYGPALAALGRVGPSHAHGTPVLVKALKDRNRKVRLVALGVLGNVGPAAAPAAIPAVEQLLLDDDLDTRHQATVAISKLLGR